MSGFSVNRALNLPISGPLIQEKALSVAEKLGIANFKASNGWLDRFKTSHNIGTSPAGASQGKVVVLVQPVSGTG